MHRFVTMKHQLPCSLLTPIQQSAEPRLSTTSVKAGLYGKLNPLDRRRSGYLIQQLGDFGA